MSNLLDSSDCLSHEYSKNHKSHKNHKNHHKDHHKNELVIYSKNDCTSDTEHDHKNIKFEDFKFNLIKGDKGERGPRGHTGHQGIPGKKGDKGEQGERGKRGHTGPQGPVGPQGPLGPPGPQGEPGPIGPQGIPGSAVYKGDKGDKGDTGEKGDKGDTGAKGDKGDMGDKGDRGEKGDKGDVGNIGPRGTVLDYAYYYNISQQIIQPLDPVLFDFPIKQSVGIQYTGNGIINLVTQGVYKILYFINEKSADQFGLTLNDNLLNESIYNSNNAQCIITTTANNIILKLVNLNLVPTIIPATGGVQQGVNISIIIERLE